MVKTRNAQVLTSCLFVSFRNQSFAKRWQQKRLRLQRPHQICRRLPRTSNQTNCQSSCPGQRTSKGELFELFTCFYKQCISSSASFWRRCLSKANHLGIIAEYAYQQWSQDRCQMSKCEKNVQPDLDSNHLLTSKCSTNWAFAYTFSLLMWLSSYIMTCILTEGSRNSAGACLCCT